MTMLLGCGSRGGGETSEGTTETTGETDSEGESSTSDEPGICEAECDLSVHDGCGPGLKCAATPGCQSSPAASSCQPAGEEPLGADCAVTEEGADDCEAGAWCHDSNFDGVGMCAPFCTGIQGDCPPGFLCNLTADGTVPACFAECDPLLEDSCGDPYLRCTPLGTGAGFTCRTRDPNIPSASAGDGCSSNLECAAGHVCNAAGLAGAESCNDSACCAELCDLAEPGCNCVPYAGATGSAWENVGVCGEP